MHTRVFGYYDGPEEVFLRTPCNTEINLIGNYGETANVDFTIVDETGVPVSGAVWTSAFTTMPNTVR